MGIAKGQCSRHIGVLASACIAICVAACGPFIAPSAQISPSSPSATIISLASPTIVVTSIPSPSPSATSKPIPTPTFVAGPPQPTATPVLVAYLNLEGPSWDSNSVCARYGQPPPYTATYTVHNSGLVSGQWTITMSDSNWSPSPASGTVDKYQSVSVTVTSQVPVADGQLITGYVHCAHQSSACSVNDTAAGFGC